MRPSRYTSEPSFRCLEDLRETSSEVSLIHFGWENCKPYHVFAGEREEYILHIILSGRGFYTADDNTRNLTAGQMFLIRPGQPVVYCSDRHDPWRYLWFGFRGERVKSILNHCGFTKNRLVLPAPVPESVISIQNEMFEHITLDYADALFREASLFKFLSLLCEHASHLPALTDTEGGEDTVNPYVVQAIDYINSNYMHSISVSDIAERIGISRTYLNRLFKLEYNMPAQEFLMDFRMRKAEFFLLNTSRPVKEIARDTGYQDQLVFSKAFKKRFDLSPKQYRLTRQELEFHNERPDNS